MPGEFDMRRQQEEATRRMREMQARARSSRQSRAPAQTPPEQHSLEQPASEQHSAEQSVPEQHSLEQHAPPESAGTGLLDVLFRDRERTVILALLLLLDGEDGNHELMFALLFLLL